MHVFDLILLPTTHPNVNQQILKGFLVSLKQNVHEQNNKIIKGLGSATSLPNTQDLLL